MPKKIKVLFLTSELTPLAKVGGLADVAGSLPKNLKKLGVDIRVVLPYYEVIKKQKINAKQIYNHLHVPFGKNNYTANIYQSTIPNSVVPLYLIHHHKHLSTGPVYSGGIERFMFYTQAINEFLKLNLFQPDIIHINDWHPCNINGLLKKDPDHKLKKYKTLLTVHNLAMQGIIKNTKTKLWHPSLYQYTKNNNYNTLKQGIINSDLINTVSQQYSREILTKEYGYKLVPVLKKYQKKITGIVNGIDLEIFHPKQDKYLKKNFSLSTIKDKKINKKFLQKKAGLLIDETIPVFGLVSRLTGQKGIQMIIDNGDELAKLKAQFIFTGTGEKNLENQLKALQEKYPDKFYFLNKFDIPFGQQIYGGCDIFLMPSVFEPCGLGQMIAMTYGAIPIVRATGGLKDTVIEKKTGFVFKNISTKELLAAMKRAVKTYQNKKAWEQMVRNAMTQDLTWKNSAKKYLALYKKLAQK